MSRAGAALAVAAASALALAAPAAAASALRVTAGPLTAEVSAAPWHLSRRAWSYDRHHQVLTAAFTTRRGTLSVRSRCP